MYTSLQDLFRKPLNVEYNNRNISFNTLLRVELGLRLLEVLGLESNSILTVWALNQGLQVPAFSELNPSPIQRRWLANFRALIHRSSLRDWQADFGLYALYAENLRLYTLFIENGNFETATFARTGRQPQRINIYDNAFRLPLPFKKEKRNHAAEGKFIYAINRDFKGELVFSASVLQEMRKHKIIPFGKRKERKAIEYSHIRLKELAQELDRVEQAVNLPRLNKWSERITKIVRFRARQEDGQLSEPNTRPLAINGMTHLAGMVGSGKSTIATLIAYDIAQHQKNHRVTLVVADVAEVMRLTEYFNRLFAVDTPVAVPLLGPTMRDAHLTSVFRQNDFSITQDQWKLRFLDTTCLVAHWLTNIDDSITIGLPPGHEPCHALYEEHDKAEKKKYFLCPLFSICPMQQVYRDMPEAKIWITTMGGLGQAKVPAQVDERHPPLWLTIYENSSLVIFDEVDVIQGWFDKLLAPDLILDDTGAGGLLQETLRKLGTYPSGTFRQNTDLDRWRQTYDLTMPALRNFLGLLERNDDLRDWLSVRPFTSLRILSELAGRISGFFLWEDEEVSQPVAQLNSHLRDLFMELQKHDLSSIDFGKPDPKDELILLSTQITSYGRSEINSATNKKVEAWIKKQMETLPEPVRRQIELRAKAYEDKHHSDEKGPPLEIAKLTHRLELGLVASVLDSHLRGLFYGWHSVQELLGEEGMPSLIPTSLSGLLPVPPLGRWRGFRTASESDNQVRTLSLAVFEYASVGRYFVQNFDHLLQDLDGLPGPNVLAMSGTSWMPDSARYHFDLPIVGILEPEKSIQDAIRGSTFTYLPQTALKGKNKNRDNKYLRISGAGISLTENLEQVTLALAKKPDNNLSPLARELDKLESLSKEGGVWEDRARVLLLVNSYDQAQKVASLLQNSLRPDLAKGVYAIVRSDEDSSLWDWRPYKSIKRSNVEDSGHLARILVAPMGAIGRGYNIVSPKTGKAAYGAIYFLLRPMTPPFDAMTMVAGMNHKLDQWLKPDGTIWNKSKSDILSQVERLHKQARDSWQAMERGKFYRIMDEEDRKELAATTASSIIQACGRLVRGGVPFRAYFVDASWVNGNATEEGDFIANPKYSLLAATIERLIHYTSHEVGNALYGAFITGLCNPQGLHLDLMPE